MTPCPAPVAPARTASRRFAPSVLAEALVASWDHRTAYGGAVRPGNPAFGQCYPTSRVVQWFYPDCEIAKGEVWTGAAVEHHFWNIRGIGPDAEWLDLSWSQFPPGSVVQRFVLLDRTRLGDSPGTVARCALLLRRVLSYLERSHPPFETSDKGDLIPCTDAFELARWR